MELINTLPLLVCLDYLLCSYSVGVTYIFLPELHAIHRGLLLVREMNRF